ncbi:hypothetical protein IEQ34_021034 [Dendrobium chrysotoxum]|uniref:Secreted protein n=1 Tax=Dendrobium chrysotoxum TaxID=161865 RepID=A0AAV7G2C0_DENCH|nr:hypothetical protein IEQ34_021034 [Dendrobium chrysotoxum]
MPNRHTIWKKLGDWIRISFFLSHSQLAARTPFTPSAPSKSVLVSKLAIASFAIARFVVSCHRS